MTRRLDEAQERAVAKAAAQLRLTEQRPRAVTVDGEKVDVPVTVATNRDGSLAFYQRGTGPFTTNRAARRRRK